MNLIIVGSVAIDDVETPSGRRENSVGGSANYATIAASKFCEVGIVGVVGEDYPDEAVKVLEKNKVDTAGLEKVAGKTFRWRGKYTDLNRAETLDTQLNVFADFSPKLPPQYTQVDYVFLGNIHPQLQLDVIAQAKNAKLIALDTMNLWINITSELLKQVISKVHILFINEEEIKMLTSKQNIFDAADEILAMGVKYVILKRGEYGAVAIGKDFLFFVPIYPVRKVFDPTGAGDSFAGGFLGYVVKVNDLSTDTIKKAMLYGTVTASINIESFSYDRLNQTDMAEINRRVDYLKSVMTV